MLRLLYFSTAAADLPNAEVDDIVVVDEAPGDPGGVDHHEGPRHAARANSVLGITGALAFNGRNFCQLLEGPEGEVRALVDIISKDSRHSGFKIIDEKEVDEPFFPGWSMPAG